MAIDVCRIGCVAMRVVFGLAKTRCAKEETPEDFGLTKTRCAKVPTLEVLEALGLAKIRCAKVLD